MPKEITKKKATTKKSAPVAQVVAPVKKAAAKATAVVKAKAEPAKAKVATALKPKKSPAAPKTTKTKTTIVAKYDAGFGNSLYLRGEGAGLGWDKGVLMSCAAADEWSYTVEGATSALAVKVLINDTTWSSGPNIDVPIGQKIVFTPSF